jgi:hypothetical protein
VPQRAIGRPLDAAIGANKPIGNPAVDRIAKWYKAFRSRRDHFQQYHAFAPRLHAAANSMI